METAQIRLFCLKMTNFHNENLMNTTPDNQTVERREAIAVRLRSAREAAGLSQGQVARKMELHRPAISEIEAGRRRVSAEELVVFAELYGVSVEWISGAQSPEPDPAEDRMLMAARELSKLKEGDLERLIDLIHAMKRSK